MDQTMSPFICPHQCQNQTHTFVQNLLTLVCNCFCSARVMLSFLTSFVSSQRTSAVCSISVGWRSGLVWVGCVWELRSSWASFLYQTDWSNTSYTKNMICTLRNAKHWANKPEYTPVEANITAQRECNGHSMIDILSRIMCIFFKYSSYEQS